MCVESVQLNGTTKMDWDLYMFACKIINVSFLVIVLWILFCMIAYGSKTSRWRKKSASSSLNNGAIYVTCTVAVMLFIIKQCSTILFIYLPKSDFMCELLLDIDTVISAVTASAAYFFLWLRQRLIRKHPCVKRHIPNWLDGLSYLYVILLGLFTAGLICLYAIPKSYCYSETVGYCIHNETGKSNFFKNLIFIEGYGADILLASTLFLAQLFILVLTIYPAVGVRVETSASMEDMTQEPDEEGRRPRRRSTMKISSPIRSTVRRLLFSSVTIVFIGLTVLVIAIVVIPAGAPVGLRQTVFELSGFANVFCMLFNFNFADKVIFLFCRMISWRSQ